jgi:hypothetical protein
MADADVTPTGGNDLPTALAWLHERIGHRFNLDGGAFVIEDAMLRGAEPGFRFRESDESYALTVYVPVFTLTLDPPHLRVEVVDGSLQLHTRWGHLGLDDADAPPPDPAP